MLYPLLFYHRTPQPSPLFEHTDLAEQSMCQPFHLVDITQIPHAQEIFTPKQEKIDEARKLTAAYRESEERGEGAVMIDGKFADAATVRYYANTLDLAELYDL